ncbi:MFS transporter [Parasporobacterium paucivorans]|uniref:Predicted arabinose efflux permease, MFS family n=1 Tax=Parasporobacterium paucivorans DSM 15970 TaxID=1122934 RepID=A0A1M6L3V8_9FIRM|nr:MFS transporter [Parasporobacterium paucivorans]SHJ65843.1 Predicted arabinose efflux permease, MFS family [Parasporobacterium paucivorans DSM 15970]
MNQSKLWSKDFTIITITTFFTSLTFYLLVTTLAVYAIKQFGASQGQAGLASGIFVIGAVFSRIIAGKYIEVIGRRNLLFTALILFLLASLSYFPADKLNLLLAVRFVHGAAFGAASTAMATAIMDIIPNERRGEGTGYYSLSVTLSSAIGPFLGLFISQHANFNIIFATCTVFSIISIVVILFAKIPEANLSKEQSESMKGLKLKDFFEIKAIPISIIALIMGTAYSGILSYINAYALDINLTSAASLFFVVYSATCLISRPLSGKLLDSRGDNSVMYPSLLFFVLGLILLSRASSGHVLLLSGIFIALGYGTAYTCTQAIAIKESPKHRVGLATSTFFIFLDTGVGVGPLLIGTFIPKVGFRGMYMALAAMVFLSILLYHLIHGKKSSGLANGRQPFGKAKTE